MNVVDRSAGRRSAQGKGNRGRRWPLVLLAARLALVCFVGSAAARPAAAKPPLRIGMTFSGYQYWDNPAKFAAAGREVNTELTLAYGALFHQLPSGKIAPAMASSW